LRRTPPWLALGVLVGTALVASTVDSAGAVAQHAADVSHSQPASGWTFDSAPRGTVYFPDDGFRLEPGGTVSPAASVRTKEEALALLARYVSLPSATDTVGGAPVVRFGLFTNDSSGVEQDDGSLELIDVDEPAWLFTWSLVSPREVPGHVHGRPDPTMSRAPGGCVFSALVTTTGTVPVAGQECSSDSSRPVFSVKE
jgi:hypothetical protein